MDAQFRDHVGVAVIVAFVEEFRLFLLQETHTELDHEGGDEADQRGFECS